MRVEEEAIMVALYVGGQMVGTLADLERLLPELVAKRQTAELRDDSGNRIGTINPEPTPVPAPGEPLHSMGTGDHPRGNRATDDRTRLHYRRSA